jgi:hypothetical protein
MLLGPFTGKTSHPILYISNKADNITPLISARNNSAGFPGSVVLVQNSYGVGGHLLAYLECHPCLMWNDARKLKR